MSRKRRRKGRELAVAAAAEVVAERHGFDAGGLLGHATGEYAVNVSEQTLLAIDTAFACVRLIADLVSDADVGEYRGADRLDDTRLVRRPMATITRRTWLWQVAASMAMYNGCYYRRMGLDSTRTPLSLVPISPNRVSGTSAEPRIDGIAIEPDELGYIPRATWPTVTRELGTVIRLARDAFAAAWAAQAYGASFWESGGAPVLVLTSDQDLTAAQAEAIQDRWAERRVAGPGKPPVLGKGVRVERLGALMDADGASSSADGLRSSVARYFGIPAWLVNVPQAAGSMTYSNASAAGLDLVRYTLRPGYAGPIGDALSDELPGDYLAGRRVTLGLDHLTHGTMLERFQAYQIATGGLPWMTPAEVRTELHLPMDTALDPAGAPAPALETIT